MNGHTGGPWGVSFNGKCTWNIEEISGDKRHIASAGRQQDARLIAVAPGLLEACKAALVYCQSDPAIHPLNEKLRAAIAAAEGK